MKCEIRLPRASAAAMACLLACSCYGAGTIHTSDSLYIRENGIDYNVTFTVPNGEMINYKNGENCGSGHKTAKGGRYFNHFHISYTLPKTGVDDNGNARTITNAKIDAFWDNYYAGYTRVAGSDHTYNCWGYAFGFSVWIQDPAHIYADDYKATTDVKVGNVIKKPGHAIKITQVCDNGESPSTIKETREKNRASGIYKKTYACPAGGSPGGTMYEKK